jgi:hypothetical protein
MISAGQGESRDPASDVTQLTAQVEIKISLGPSQWA